MFKAVIQEAAALASLSLFLGMIAIWTQVLGNCESQAFRRHVRPCAGHPRLKGVPHLKAWMAGTSPAMTRGDVGKSGHSFALPGRCRWT